MKEKPYNLERKKHTENIEVQIGRKMRKKKIPNGVPGFELPAG